MATTPTSKHAITQSHDTITDLYEALSTKRGIVNSISLQNMHSDTIDVSVYGHDPGGGGTDVAILRNYTLNPDQTFVFDGFFVLEPAQKLRYKQSNGSALADMVALWTSIVELSPPANPDAVSAFKVDETHNSWTNLYTAPAGKVSVLKGLSITNTRAGLTTVSVRAYDPVSTDAVPLLTDYRAGVDENIWWDGVKTLKQNQILQYHQSNAASTGSILDCWASFSELT